MNAVADGFCLTGELSVLYKPNFCISMYLLIELLDLNFESTLGFMVFLNLIDYTASVSRLFYFLMS